MSFKKIKFLTDSTCDIPADLLHKHDIAVSPAFVNYGGESYADNGKELIREDFYKILPTLRPYPTSAAMSPTIAEEAIESQLAKGDHLVIVTVGKNLSGINNVMRLASQKFPADRITLIDSMTTTMGLGWQVLIGAEVAEANGNPEEVADVIERVRRNSMVYAALDTLEFVHRSGRVSWTAASIGALLQIKPILEIRDGKVESAARIRTFARAFDECVKLAKNWTPIDRIAILHVNNVDRANTMKERLESNGLLPDNVIINSIAPAIGTNIGPDGISIVPVRAHWRTP